jgi:hypothetical protein
MPRVMAKLTSLTSLTIILCSLLVLSASSMVVAESVELIVSANSYKLFPVNVKDPVVEDAPELFEKKLLQLKKKNRDAIFVDAGNALSLNVANESAYSYSTTELFGEVGYLVQNLSPRDAVLSISLGVGYHKASDKIKEPVITNLETQNPGPLGLPLSKRVTEGDFPITFVSLSDFSATLGLSGKVGEMSPELQLDALAKEIAKAKSKGDVVVGFVSMSEENRKTIFSDEESTPDLIIDLDESGIVKGDKGPKGSWVLSAPAGGSIYHLELEKGKKGRLEKPEPEIYEVLSQEEDESLVPQPVFNVGFPLPNLESVTVQYFGISADSVRMDRLDASDAGHLTNWKEIMVYHFNLEGKKLRLYRVFCDLRQTGDSDFLVTGWPRFDFLVLVNDDSTIKQVYNRSKFPIGMLPTTLTEALNKLAGQDPEKWEPATQLAAGIEELWQVATAGMVKVVEMDKEFYGEKGIYSQPE